MDKAKAAVSEFVGRAGHHDTTVDESQSPAIKHEEIQPLRHENITTAVDREVHQDHFHTTVQPIKDREVLPEKHSHQMAGIQTKEFEHANPQDTRARLDREAQQFRDTSTTHNTKHIQAAAPTVEGELHETVQPVVEKEIIAPSVVHTTVPVHEKHHAAPEHHGTSVLPTKTMTDFKSTGQNLTGSTGIINQDQYDGCPRPYNSEMQIGRTDADADPHVHLHGDHHHGDHHHGSHTTAGPHSSDTANRADPRVDNHRDGRGLGAGAAGVGAGTMGTGTHGSHTTAGPHGSDMANRVDPRVDSDRDGRGFGAGTTGSGMPGPHTAVGSHGSDMGNKLDPRVDSDMSGSHRTGAGHHNVGGGTDSTPVPTGHTSSRAAGVGDTAGHKKPSLLDRLNPMKDTDGDGQKGFMK